MVYRGIYRDGKIELDGAVDLRQGAHVDVFLSQPDLNTLRRGKLKSRAKKRRASSEKMTKGIPFLKSKEARIAAVLAAYGTWADPPEWRGKSSGEISLELRRQGSRRGPNA
jgi:hypothetical protein